MDFSNAGLWTITGLIFLARVIDVSLGTLRIIFVSRQRKGLAAAAGFFEVLVWLIAIAQVFSHLSSWIHLVTYAAGFAVGNYVGIWIEEKLAMGLSVLRIITKKEATELREALQQENIGYTLVDAEGASGPVNIIFLVIKRRNIPQMLQLIARFNPHAFYTIEDVKSAKHGIFPLYKKESARFLHHDARKGK